MKNETGETLFRLGVEGRNAVQPILPMTETEPPSSNAETNGSVAASPPPEDTASTPSASLRAEAAQKPPAQTDTIDGNTRRESPNAPIDTQTAEHQAPQPDEAPGMEK